MPNPSTVASQDEPEGGLHKVDPEHETILEPQPQLEVAREPAMVAIFHTGKTAPIRATSWTHEDGGWYAEGPISTTASSMKWIPDSAILYVEFVEELPA